MNKRVHRLLERAFAAEVSSALNGGPHVIQIRGKLAEELVAHGLLRSASVRVGHGSFSVVVDGYELTDVGRLAYCMTCDDAEMSP